jgi:hypothetical protein
MPNTVSGIDWIPVIYVLLVIGLLGVLKAIVFVYLMGTGTDTQRARSQSTHILVILLIYLFGVIGFTQQGYLSFIQDSWHWRLLFVIPFLLSLSTLLIWKPHPAGLRMTHWGWIILPHTFRLITEVIYGILETRSSLGGIPLLSFERADLWFGATAPLVAIWVIKSKRSLPVFRAWTLLGLVSVTLSLVVKVYGQNQDMAASPWVSVPFILEFAYLGPMAAGLHVFGLKRSRAEP